MRVTKRCTPVPSSNRQDTQFRDDDGGADSGGYFFGGLDAETDVAFRVANDNNGLESGTLTGASLLLDGLDLYAHQTASAICSLLLSTPLHC